VGLGVFIEQDGSVGAAGGFLIQALPPQDDEVIDLLMERIGQLPPLSEHFHDGGSPEALFERLFEGIPYEVLEKRALAFHCSCTREKGEKALLIQGRPAIDEIIAEEGAVAVSCTYCGEEWRFTPSEVERLFSSPDEIGQCAKKH